MEENTNNPKVEIISERKLKWYKFKAACREKAIAARDWCVENKEMVALIISGGVALANTASKLSTTRRTEEKRVEYYDPHTCAHWQLKRRLTNAERAELMRRQRDGEYTEDILDDMRVLK